MGYIHRTNALFTDPSFSSVDVPEGSFINVTPPESNCSVNFTYTAALVVPRVDRGFAGWGHSIFGAMSSLMVFIMCLLCFIAELRARQVSCSKYKWRCAMNWKGWNYGDVVDVPSSFQGDGQPRRGVVMLS